MLRQAAVLALLALPGAPLRSQDTVRIPMEAGDSLVADEYGEGSHAVVLAHGGRYDRASWRPQAAAFAAAGLRVLAIDFRAAIEARAGHPSDCLYDAACLADDVLAAVRYLRRTGAATVSVVGASLGGGAAAQAAAEAAPGEIDRVGLLAHLPVSAPEAMQGRKLFVVSRADTGSGGRPRLPGIREQYERATGPKSLLVLEGSAHAQAIFPTDQGERLLRELIAFLLAP